MANLLDRRVGYAEDVTGGSTLYTVTNNNDSGAGSLREGLEAGGKWIVFDNDYTINLASEVNPATNTTIDGRGRTIEIVSSAGLTEFRLRNPNLIVCNVKFNVSGSTTTVSASVLQGLGVGAHNIWFDHCNFFDGNDELMSIWAWPDGNYDSGDITLTWCRWGEGGLQTPIGTSQHAILVGRQLDESGDQSRCRITMAYNRFHTFSRQPLIGEYARTHMYNNLHERWVGSCILCRWGSQVLIENEIFAEPSNNLDSAFGTDPDRLYGDEIIAESGSWHVNGSSGTEVDPGSIFSVPYSYSLETANQSLLDDIEANAGNTLQGESAGLPPTPGTPPVFSSVS